MNSKIYQDLLEEDKCKINNNWIQCMEITHIINKFRDKQFKKM